MKMKKKDTRGSTMVEVIVAFAVLTIILACFAEITSLCLQMVQRSSDARARTTAQYGHYYSGTGEAQDSGQYSGGLVFSQDGEQSFTLNVELRRKEYSIPDADGKTGKESLYYFYVAP